MPEKISQLLKYHNGVKLFCKQCSSTQGESIISLIEEICTNFEKYVGINIVNQIFQHFLHNNESNLAKNKKNVIEKLNSCKEEEKEHFIDIFLSILFHKLIDQNHIEKEFIDMINNSNYNYFGDNNEDFYQLKDLQYKDDLNSNSKFSVNKECKFFNEKIYTFENQEVIDKEISMYEYEFYKPKEMTDYPNFIIHGRRKMNENKIILPYFPFQTLQFVFSKLDEITLTDADKVVIIYEIILAIYMLYSNGFCHGNISDSCIYISSDKNAYLSAAGCNTLIEQFNSKVSNSLYFRHYDFLNDQGKNDEDNGLIYNMYSAGILFFELMTNITPEKLFSNMPRKMRFDKLTHEYYDILINKIDELKLDPKYKDIINDCMHFNKHKDFMKILNAIKDLDIYKNNKNEIENRIKNATSAEKYECTLSDLVFNFYQGNEFSKELIQTFLLNTSSFFNFNYDEEISKDKDIITLILENFEFQTCSEQYFILEDEFNFIIHEDVAEIISHNIPNDYDKPMNFINNYENGMTKRLSSIPITSLEHFLPSGNFKNLHKIWLFLIAMELNEIHTYDTYHGELSKKSIGIYYNKKTETFVPSIISFYFFYKNKYKDTKPKNMDIEKGQKKDIKAFFKIVEEIDESIYKMLSKYKNSSMNIITWALYNINLKETQIEIKERFVQNYDNYKDSSFDLDFVTFYNFFTNTNKNDPIYQIFNYFFVDHKNLLFYDYEAALNKILNVCEASTPEYFKINYENGTKDDIAKLLESITRCNSYFIEEMNREDRETTNVYQDYRIQNEIKIGKQQHVVVCNFSDSKKIHYDELNTNIANKLLYRCLIITDLHPNSIGFLVTRYLKNLNPIYNYKVTLRLPQNSPKELFDRTISLINGINCTTSMDSGNIIILKKRQIF